MIYVTPRQPIDESCAPLIFGPLLPELGSISLLELGRLSPLSPSSEPWILYIIMCYLWSDLIAEWHSDSAQWRDPSCRFAGCPIS